MEKTVQRDMTPVVIPIYVTAEADEDPGFMEDVINILYPQMRPQDSQIYMDGFRTVGG